MAPVIAIQFERSPKEPAAARKACSTPTSEDVGCAGK